MRIRQLLLIIAMLLVGATTMAGQDLGDKVRVAYSLAPQPRVTVTNIYSSPITAMAITMVTTDTAQRTEGIFWYDSGVDFPHNAPLYPGQSHTFAVSPPSRAPQLQPHLWAVEFQDGKSFGDQHWLSELHARRQATYQEIAKVTTVLSQATSAHQTNQDILFALDSERTSLKASSPDRDSNLAAMFVTEWAMGNLKAPAGPVASYVNMDPQKRIPDVILPAFSRWSAALIEFDKSLQ